jgi:hypothetical protein
VSASAAVPATLFTLQYRQLLWMNACCCCCYCCCVVHVGHGSSSLRTRIAVCAMRVAAGHVMHCWIQGTRCTVGYVAALLLLLLLLPQRASAWWYHYAL